MDIPEYIKGEDNPYFVFNEETGTIKHIKELMKPVGYGIFMLEKNNRIEFYDAKEDPIKNYYNGDGLTPVFAAGSRDGFLYDGKKLIHIQISDTAWIPYSFEVFENRYLTYSYQTTEKKQEQIFKRIVDLSGLIR
jgi:hypothetical protein